MMDRFSAPAAQGGSSISATGGRLGFVGDLELKVPEGEVKALIVFGPCRFFGLFGRGEDFYVPWTACSGSGTTSSSSTSPSSGGRRTKSAAAGAEPGQYGEKTADFPGETQKSLANSYGLWYDISAFRTGADSRSVPQGWPGGGSLWR